MSLSPENIRFIDNYLKHTDIRYVDVRMELLDHIATAVEKDMQENHRSFYDAFKDYMVRHKKQLEKDYERLKRDLQKKSFGILGRKMLTPPFLFLFVVVFGTLFFWDWFLNIYFPYPYVVWASYFVSVFGYFIGTLPKKKFRFSSLEMLPWPIFFGMYFLNFYFNFSHPESVYIQRWPLLSMFLGSFFLCANTAFLVLFLKKRKQVKQKMETCI